MNILVDIGNSRLKWVFEHDGEFTEMQSLAHTDNIEDCLLQAWVGIDEPDRVAISNVAGPEITARLTSLMEKLWLGVEIMYAQAQAESFGVKNAYPDPELLGVDRWLSLIAVRRDYILPAVIVDCGTAITLDVLDDQGNHRGGLIAPGLNLMKQSLQQGAHNLDFYSDQLSVGLSNSTDAAIHSGTVYSVVGMIEFVVNKLLASEGQEVTLIMTGGDAELLAQHLDHPAIVEPNIVLQGLSLLQTN